MPTIISHLAVPLAVGLGLGRGRVSRRLLAAGIAASMLPDLDVVTFRLGIAYGSDFGHRGFSHSLLFAAMVALLALLANRFLHSTRRQAFFFIFMSAASHGILDAFTNGGRGVEFLWPFSSERFFAPFQVIQVSPIGISRFLSGNANHVIASELAWVWLPCVAAGAILWGLRTSRRSRPDSTRTN